LKTTIPYVRSKYDRRRTAFTWPIILTLLCAVGAHAQSRTPSMEETLTWKDCGTTCGASAGSGAHAYGTETLVSSIDLDGVSAEFHLSPKDPYGNFYWYGALPKPASPTVIDGRYVEYVYSIYVPSTYSTCWHAVEWGVSVRNNGMWWRSAYQLSKNSGFRFYDPSKKGWVSTGIALYNFTAGKWHQIRVRSRLHDATNNHRIEHLFIEIDGVRKTLTNLSNAAVKDGSTSNTYKASFQLDGEKLPMPYSVYFDKMLVTTWF
jgi:hypothetical protein